MSAFADGFSSAHTEVFTLNTPGRDLTIEAMRQNQNAAARAAAGAANGQGNSNMANVIQVTENYNVVLNGNNNALSTVGSSVNGTTQNGNGVGQTANNQIQTNNDTQLSNSNSGPSSGPNWLLNP